MTICDTYSGQESSRLGAAGKATANRFRDRNMRAARRVDWRTALLLLLLTTPMGVLASELPLLPQFDERIHEGVKTCASSTCHGATEPFQDSRILHNAYLTWHRRDPHSRAWETLWSEDSQRMAERMGLGAAHEADTCLACHSGKVPEAYQGERFQVSDGVGCETCHGGSGDWLEEHVSGELSHEAHIERGMYPTADPEARAELCMSCHYSHPQAPMTHDLMAAGHPPLLFEVETFRRLQPPHYEYSEAYRERKDVASPLDEWLIGQGVAARAELGAMGERIHGNGGPFPELEFFHCGSCHHDIHEPSWETREIAGLSPGTPPIADETLRMVGLILDAFGHDDAGRWRDLTHDLQVSMVDERLVTTEISARMRAIVDGWLTERRGAEADNRDFARLLAALVEDGAAAVHSDRELHLQQALALDSLLAASAWLDEPLSRAHRAGLERGVAEVYAVLETPPGHAPGPFRERMRQLRGALPQ